MNDASFAVPSNVDYANARLPESYTEAKQALEHCYSIDECKKWADRAAALASYAKQANDETLFKTAKRIQGRAINRAGKLLSEYDGRGGDRSGSKNDVSVNYAPTKRDAGISAGLSERQIANATRVANIPDQQFESLIERGEVPTIKELADIGTEKREKPSAFGDRTVAEFEAAADLEALFIALAVKGGTERSLKQCCSDLKTLQRWIARVETCLMEAGCVFEE